MPIAAIANTATASIMFLFLSGPANMSIMALSLCEALLGSGFLGF
jgi:hypothetical protein